MPIKNGSKGSAPKAAARPVAKTVSAAKPAAKVVPRPAVKTATTTAPKKTSSVALRPKQYESPVLSGPVARTSSRPINHTTPKVAAKEQSSNSSRGGLFGGLFGGKQSSVETRPLSEHQAPVVPRPHIDTTRPSAAGVAGGIVASGVSSFVNNFASEAGSSMGASYADLVNQKNENLMTDLRLEEEAKMYEADRERRIQDAILNLPCECSHCGAPPSGESLYCEYCDCKLIEEVK